MTQTPLGARIDELEAENKRLREQVKPSGDYACHCDIEDTKDGKPDACVFDNGDIVDCIYATKLQRDGKGRNDCQYWQPIKITHQAVPVSVENWNAMVEELARLRKLESFALAVLEESRDELGDLDGGWLQDKAEECGLLVRVHVIAPCGEDCRCDDFPQDCLRGSPEVVAALAVREKTP